MAVEDVTSTAKIGPPRTVVSRPGTLVLHVEVGPVSNTYELDKVEVTVGRSELSDVTLEHSSVSKQHFSLELTAQGVRLRDLGSRNGTWLGVHRIEGAYIEPGDEFLAGECRIRLEAVRDLSVLTIDVDQYGQLHGGSAAMRELYAQIAAVAASSRNLLIRGEAGTGKELVARTIHEASGRPGPFVVLDCASLPPHAAAARLLGFTRAAVPESERDQAGCFELAEGGTLFVDEVAELPLEAQALLNGILERGSVSRLGGPDLPRPIDVRVIAATRSDLRQGVAQHTLREDLYRRLAQRKLVVPPLRDRGADIVSLAELFLTRARRTRGLSTTLGTEAIGVLVTHDWPGNVRELGSAIERAAHSRPGGAIRPEDLMLNRPGHLPKDALGTMTDEQLSYSEMHERFDQLTLPRLYEHCGGNISEMARQLDLSRDTVRKRLAAIGVHSTR